MAWRIRFTKEAAAQVEALPRKIAGQVISRIAALAHDPRPPQARRLTQHEHLYRLRQGDHRILYQVEDSSLLVLVVKVGHRRDVYRRLPPSG